jgi:hypothetical protein
MPKLIAYSADPHLEKKCMIEGFNMFIEKNSDVDYFSKRIMKVV